MILLTKNIWKKSINYLENDLEKVIFYVDTNLKGWDQDRAFIQGWWESDTWNWVSALSSLFLVDTAVICVKSVSVDMNR